MGDHPPITPVRAAMPGFFVGDMARLYDLVTRHFIATVSEDATFLTTQVQFRAASFLRGGGGGSGVSAQTQEDQDIAAAIQASLSDVVTAAASGSSGSDSNR